MFHFIFPFPLIVKRLFILYTNRVKIGRWLFVKKQFIIFNMKKTVHNLNGGYIIITLTDR